jgi:outer membrane protein assembly factor BamD (BamD/ComL family)
MKNIPIFLLLFTPTLFAGHLYELPEVPGYPTAESYLVSKREKSTKSYQEHFDMAMKAYQEGSYEEAATQFRIVKYNFPLDQEIQNSLFDLGICYMKMAELESANREFNHYLRGNHNPVYFAEVIENKFRIAESFKDGAKRRMFNSRNMPKVMSGADLALEIYDEVIAAVPSHDMAAKALFSKANLLWDIKEWKESVETFQTLVRRFPKHELSPDAYVSITKVYLEQGEFEYQNPDLIVFGEINLRRFQLDFPREERVAEVAQDVQTLKEVYANGLYETGLFYERTEKPKASVLYYKSAIERFPETEVASKCGDRLAILEGKA